MVLESNEVQSVDITELCVRKAHPEDVMAILRWRNDPLVRAMSRHQEPISDADHIVWYSRAVDDPNRLLLIGVLGEKKIGIVRFDHSRASLWEVSIAIAAEARGQGLGRHFLKMALDWFCNLYAPTSVLAVVSLNNEPSLRIFHSLGFCRKNVERGFANLILSSNGSPLSP